MTTILRAKLVSALTQYDVRQAAKPGYNPHALAQYLARIDDVIADIEAGADVRAAIVAGFSGRLATAALKAAGLGAITRNEAWAGKMTYRPAKA